MRVSVRSFPSLKGEPALLGYGCMRFPTHGPGGSIDRNAAEPLLRRAMEAGINYYDTAWPYHGGESETFVGEVLGSYSRESYYLATKLPCWQISSVGQVRQTVEEQLRRLGTDHIDFYLLHSLNRGSWKRMVQIGAVEELEQLRGEGKLCRLGFSFHDAYPVFAQILTAHQWDFCQIQLNYLDIQFQAGLRGCNLAGELGVPVVVMEPVKGGVLANLSPELRAPLDRLHPEWSSASWALRWAASRKEAAVVLSGMGTARQLEDNLSAFSPFTPLTREEEAALKETEKLLRARMKNGCTGCRYCMPCPAGVDIPGNFSVWNQMAMLGDRQAVARAWENLDLEERAQNCYGCGRCERLCPQQIPIRRHLAALTSEVESFLEEK